jgi:transcriptional regulator with XRE-family HTH domain
MQRRAPEDATFQEARDRLAARMRYLRGAANMPQSHAARLAGLDRTSWGRIEAGKLDVRLDTLLRIQFALGVDTLEGLFGETTGDLFGRDPSVETGTVDSAGEG